MAQTRDVKEPLYIENTCLKAEPLSCLIGEEDRFNAESIVRIMSALDRNDCRMEIADDWGIQVSKETLEQVFREPLVYRVNLVYRVFKV